MQQGAQSSKGLGGREQLMILFARSISILMLTGLCVSELRSYVGVLKVLRSAIVRFKIRQFTKQARLWQQVFDRQDILQAIDCNGELPSSPHSCRSVKQLLNKSSGSGSLDYTEFLAATLDQKVYMQRDLLRASDAVLVTKSYDLKLRPCQDVCWAALSNL